MATGLQTTIGVILMACIIACIVYWFFPTGKSEYPHLELPNLFDLFWGVPPAPAPVPAPEPEPEPEPEPPAPPVARCPVPNCEMRCQEDRECPAGLGCVGGICRCRSKLGGVCRQPGDCDCRLGIKCSLPERKCVPNNFYFDFGEAAENCPNGVRRGYFYDPYLLMSDGTQGDFQRGFRCV